MKKIYALLTLVGIALPFSQFITWLIKYGFNLVIFFQHIITNPLATFAWLDVIVTVVVIIFLIIQEGKKLKIKNLWIPIVASFIGGASVGLPLFLYMRQAYIENLDLKSL